LLKPEVKQAEASVLKSRSVREFPFFLDKTFDEGAPHDYVLYRDYVWTVDEDLRFEPDLWLAKKCLEREWQRIEFSTNYSNGSHDVERPPIPESIRHEVWRRDRGQCARCGSRERLEYDHIIPIAMGGSNTARNIELLCETCNRQKGASLSVR